MAANTGQTSPDDGWLNKVEEEILEPDLAIIDPHHHLWLRNGYTYLMPELAVDLGSGHNVVATVYAECHS
ncbi:MAG: amidohydrolase, partial [Alphaproteobacteria bacterium]|nr:amidohydrolase [Alphaproteobacteria bacterium]